MKRASQKFKQIKNRTRNIEVKEIEVKMKKL